MAVSPGQPLTLAQLIANAPPQISDSLDPPEIMRAVIRSEIALGRVERASEGRYQLRAGIWPSDLIDALRALPASE